MNLSRAYVHDIYELHCDGKIVSGGKINNLNTLQLWLHQELLGSEVHIMRRIFRAASLKLKWTTVSRAQVLVAT